MHLFIPSTTFHCRPADPRSHYYWLSEQLPGRGVLGRKLHDGFVLSGTETRLVHK